MKKKQTKIIALEAIAGAGSRLAFPVAVSEDGTPPTEFLLFHAGANETTKGTFTFTKSSAKSVMADYADRGIERHGDWEHASLSPASALADGGAPASCWYELALRDGDGGPELWAVNVRWTPKAASQLKNKEYRYYSTVFVHTEDGEIAKFLNLGITNDPATHNQAPLVAATARIAKLWANKESNMDEEKMKAFKAALAALAEAMDGDDGEKQKEAMKAMKACLADAMPDDEDKKDEEKLADDEPADGDKKDESDKKDEALSALTGKSGRSAQIATLTAWKDAASQVAELSARLAKIEGEKAVSDFDSLISTAKRDGKLSPAMLSDVSKGAGKYIAACRKNKDITALSAYVEALPVLVSTQETQAPKSGVVSLTDLDMEVARRLGVNPEKLKASKSK